MDPVSHWTHVYYTRNQKESFQGLHLHSAAECCPHIFMDSIQYDICESASVYILFIFIN